MAYPDEQAENLLNSGRTFNYYLYEIMGGRHNYQQDQHYQLASGLINFTGNLQANVALSIIRMAAGFFEQYRNEDDLSDNQLMTLNIGNETLLLPDLN